MATATKWSNIAVAVQSAITAGTAITGITKANPAQVTSLSHGLANGDFVLISAQGMAEVDQRIFRVAGSTANTINLEGEDATNYGTFASGTVQKITFGTTLTSLVGVSASGGEFDMIDVTTIHDNVRKQIPGVASPSEYSFESMWDVSDAGLVALKAASDQQGMRAVRFTFANGQKLLFTGYIGATLLPTGSAQELVKTSVKITGYGKPTVYAS